MQVGKLPHDLLESLLGRVEIRDKRVVLGPQLGEDAAALDFGDRLLVAASDPVTLATDLIGWYAVQVNANDVACLGATPRWFLASLLLPPSSTSDSASNVFQQVLDACKSMGISLIGGHTEVTQGIEHPILAGCMLGEVEKGKLVRTAGALSGDSIVVTKGIAIEGSALLAREAGSRLLESGVDTDTLARARELLFTPGISVVDDALTACNTTQVHCLHDATEGGLATGLWEVAKAAGVGLVIDEGSVPILPECEAICRATGLAPLGLLASGALIITLAPENVPSLLLALDRKGISGYEIGQVTDSEEGVKMVAGHELTDLPRFQRDELARFLSP